MSNPDGRLHRFNCGNKATLDGPQVRSNILDFHKQWYSSNIMTLALTSKHSLDEMEAWVKDGFSNVENKEVVVPNLVEVDPFQADQMGRLVKMVPIKDEHKLQMFWRMPMYLELEHDKGPLNYFSHLIGHEGENSLLSYLKSKNWALGLSAGGDHELYGMSTMELNITLTKNGLENHEKVIEAVFQYTNQLHKAGPQEWIFNEVNDLGKVQFDFAEKGQPMNTVTNCAKRMQVFNDDNIVDILKSPYVKKTFD